MQALDQYRALTFRQDTYVFNDGARKELVNLSGTIPMVYKSKHLTIMMSHFPINNIILENTYHIPVIMWLMDTHPYNAPICYVTPTADMHIKVSMYVDHNGKVYLPYLHDWQPSSSDLLGLIQVMIVTFGEHPPVYSKPKDSTPYPQQSFMPQPGIGMNQSAFMSFPQTNNAFPPYPTGNANFGGSNFPPYPPSSTTSPYPSSGFMPMPNAFSPTQPASQQPNINNPAVSGTGTITEEHIKASLISAVEDKMRRRIQEKVNQYQAEIQTLNRTKQELKEGQNKLNEIIKKLERDETELKKNIQMLKDKDGELTKSLDLLEQNEDINVDEAVTTTAPLYKQ